MERDSDTSVIQYNTIFYSATMSIYCFIFAVLIIGVVVVVLLCIDFLYALASGGEGDKNDCKCSDDLFCDECDCVSFFICSKSKNNRKTRKKNENRI